MRNNFKFMLGLALMAIAAGINAQQAMAQVEKQTGLNFEKASRHRGKGHNTPPRGRGKVDKPRKRSNRLTISKRVRRRHRRAA